MKKLVSLMLITMLFTFALAQEEWMGHGVNITLMENGIIKAASTRSGLNTLISPLFPINTTLKYSFSIRSEGTKEVLAEIAYFAENRTFMFAKNVTVLGNGSFGWKNVEIVALPAEGGATFSSLVIAINGTGMVYIDNFTVSEAKPTEKPEMESMTQTKTGGAPKKTETTTSQEIGKGTIPYENSQKLSIDDDDIKVEVFLNKTYHPPGDTIRADFYITNKKGVIYEIDIRLDVYYLGIKVFSYEHPSWREYREGKTVHIFQESKLPVITPPPADTP
ncbi:hypothetical protein [Thermococcus sp. JCM 11816]|uniref:hypothetical protein n=1 Tax=Thermococcus sp. (strain JCM 11816 / KS-1) TaxID=1295125 RepID=UPI000A509052